MRELIRSAFVIGRRDFTATVFSRSFVLFLLGPLFPVLMVVMFGSIGAQASSEAERPVIAILSTPAEFALLDEARERLSKAFVNAPVVRLVRFDAGPDLAAQERDLLASRSPPVLGVMSGGLFAPHLTGAVKRDGTAANQLRLILADARTHSLDGQPLTVTSIMRSSGSLSTARSLTARAGQAILFLLTILLAGMLLSQLIEEKSNKVIEILAAAVPIDAIFVGKLFAMLLTSLLGIAVWVLAGAAAFAAFSPSGLGNLPPPAVGWAAFLILVFIYFTMSYLLIGSAFLGIGAQASTVREVQTLSMPVTMAQVLIFAFASAAVGQSDEPIGIAAAAFPLSSPFAMIARAAESADLWPHGIAIAWQMLWVALILRFASRLFRRSVLNSGPRRKWWRRATPRSASAG